MGRATSRVRSLLCTSCASGEDRGDIDIDTEVLKQITPLAQDRRARNSHHLAIVAGIVHKHPTQFYLPLLPPFPKNFWQSPYFSPQKPTPAHYNPTATTT